MLPISRINANNGSQEDWWGQPFARDYDRRLLRQLSSGDSAASAVTLAPKTTAYENRGRRPRSIVDELREEGNRPRGTLLVPFFQEPRDGVRGISPK